MIINKLPLWASTGKSALFTATPMAFLKGMMPSLHIQTPNSFTLWRDNGIPGVGPLKRSNRNKLNPDLYVPRLAKAVTHGPLLNGSWMPHSAPFVMGRGSSWAM